MARVTERRDLSRPGDGIADPDAGLAAAELAAITGGRLLAASGRPIRGGAVDSRAVEPGNLFVALPGEQTDGHAFVGAALAAGAAAALVSAAPDPADLAGRDATVVLVAEPLRALQAVAAAWRTRFDPLVVGITGSIAKTSTKEAVATVLGAAMPTLKNEGNLNNEIGLPLTVLRLRARHRAAVLEMGMYVGGEIADLARIGRPELGIVTAVQPVHLSRIGTIEAIERAKGELVEALPADGVAILNADDERVRRMAARTRGPAADLRLRRRRRRPGRAGRVARRRRHGLRARDRRRPDPGRHPGPRPPRGPQRPRRGRRRSRRRAAARDDRARRSPVAGARPAGASSSGPAG